MISLHMPKTRMQISLRLFLQELTFIFLFAITAAGVVLCGSPEKSPRTLSIVIPPVYEVYRGYNSCCLFCNCVCVCANFFPLKISQELLDLGS